MKSTTLAILATIIPAQMAFSADKAKNAMDALESLNGKGYVDLGIEETSDRIVVFGEKKGKRVALTYEKEGFDLVGKRVTKVNPKNVASDSAGDRLHEAEEETDAAREELNDLRKIGADDERIHEAEELLVDLETEEDDIRAALEATDDDKPNAKKPKVAAKPKAKTAATDVVERLHEAEEETDEARQELKDLREVGATDKRIDEAERDLHEKEEEEDDLRAIAKAKEAKPAKKEPASEPKRSKIEQRLHEAEEETDDARQELKDLREVGASDKRIDEAERDLHEKEEEEDDLRAIAKGN